MPAIDKLSTSPCVCEPKLRWWEVRVVTGDYATSYKKRTLRYKAYSHKHAQSLAEVEWGYRMRYDSGREDYIPRGIFTFIKVASVKSIKPGKQPSETNGYQQYRYQQYRSSVAGS